MLGFPLIASLVILINGRPVVAYARPFEAGGRVFAPIRPYVTDVAERLWYDGNVLVIERDGRVARVVMSEDAGRSLAHAYVAIGPVLRSLGEGVRYDGRHRALEIVTPDARAIRAPAPFDPRAYEVAPRSVFTPMPVPTPRPVWHGSPEPRRTPIPYRGCCVTTPAQSYV